MSEYIFKLPDLGEGTVESEIGEWNIAVGDNVHEEAIVGTMMTDKAAVELVSPVSGKVISLAGEPGDMIAVGAPLVVFETAAKTKPSAAKQVAPTDSAMQKEHSKVEATNDKIVTSPAIRRRARDAGIDLASVIGSGAGGRILRDDLDRVLNSARTEKSTRTAITAKTTEVKVIGLRRIIAERMTAANREVPHFSYVEEVDITDLEATRQQLNSQKKYEDRRLSPLTFLALALTRALREFPQCNTTYDKDRNLLLRHDSIHLGVATQTEDGLKVPVVRNAEQLSIEALAKEIRRVSAAARDNSIAKDQLGGSTITVTSLGKLGGIASTPIINLPEVAIIGVNRAVERPVVINGQIAVRRMMNLSSSFDHRFVDGYDAAAMIQRIKELLEHPALMFID